MTYEDALREEAAEHGLELTDEQLAEIMSKPEAQWAKAEFEILAA